MATTRSRRRPSRPRIPTSVGKPRKGADVGANIDDGFPRDCCGMVSRPRRCHLADAVPIGRQHLVKNVLIYRAANAEGDLFRPLLGPAR